MFKDYDENIINDTLIKILQKNSEYMALWDNFCYLYLPDYNYIYVIFEDKLIYQEERKINNKNQFVDYINEYLINNEYCINPQGRNIEVIKL